VRGWLGESDRTHQFKVKNLTIVKSWPILFRFR
jgi:hypothetical protein